MTTLTQITLCINRRVRSVRVTSFQVCVETHDHRSDAWFDLSLAKLQRFEAHLVARGYTSMGGSSGLRWLQKVTDTIAAGEG